MKKGLLNETSFLHVFRTEKVRQETEKMRGKRHFKSHVEGRTFHKERWNNFSGANRVVTVWPFKNSLMFLALFSKFLQQLST